MVGGGGSCSTVSPGIGMGLATEHGLSEGNAECPKQVRGSDEGFREIIMILYHRGFPQSMVGS